MKKTIRRTIRILLYVVILFALYVIASIGHGTITDYQPEEAIKLDVDGGTAEKVVSDSVLTLLNWNVGFGGLGKECNFFYDSGGFFTSGGKMVRASRKVVEKNVEGALQTLQTHDVDFYLLQEVDVKSRRSYRINQHEKYQDVLPDYAATMAVNYKVGRVPIPLLQPWGPMGKVHSGLGTYSRFQPTEATRYQFPGNYSWPMSIFQLDRCFSLHRFPTAWGKDLVVINTHNSAYDDGSLKKQQMAYLQSFLIEEYEEKGNYVIVGGDWNQCPPNFKFDSFMDEGGEEAGIGYSQINIANDYVPDGWQWGYDPRIPSNRKVKDNYVKGETFITLIDFYLTSPNIQLLAVRGVNQDFEYSDHQPILLQVRLK